jgi:hypothetical protein
MPIFRPAVEHDLAAIHHVYFLGFYRSACDASSCCLMMEVDTLFDTLYIKIR